MLQAAKDQTKLMLRKGQVYLGSTCDLMTPLNLHAKSINLSVVVLVPCQQATFHVSRAIRDMAAFYRIAELSSKGL